MTKTLTKQTTQACVLDQQGKPLMPTTRLGKVYRLLKTQKAHIVSQTHAAKDAPDFNRGRNWRTTWGK